MGRADASIVTVEMIYLGLEQRLPLPTMLG
jgi:hypothetical protein